MKNPTPSHKRLALVLVFALFLAGCQYASQSSSSASSIDASTSGSSIEDVSSEGSTVSLSEAGTSAVSGSYTSEEGTIAILLQDGASSCASSNVAIDNAQNLVTITSLGTYLLSGSLTDGAILVTAEKTDDEDTVELKLNGVSIASKGTATASVSVSSVTTLVHLGPIYSAYSAHLDVQCVSGSANVITDSRSSALTTGDDTAAIFSNKVLQIKGSGSLSVTSVYDNGIASDSKVKAAKATLSVSAPNNAVKAHNAVILGGAEDQGSFILKGTGTDSIAVRVDEVDTSIATPVYGNDETDDEIAGIEIKDGAYDVSAGANAISSEAILYVVGGNGTITSSAGKGFRSEGNILLEGGNFSVKTLKDDCIHSSSADVIGKGGSYVLTSGSTDGCQGIKGENNVVISGGSYTVTASYEGIAAHQISVSGGSTNVISSDDGWSAGGTDEKTSSACAISISGGMNYVYAGGDGLDSNGYFSISGGTTVVAAPSNGGNGPLDSGDGYAINCTGGDVIAYGITGMTENLSGSQNSLVLYSHTSFSSGKYYVIAQGEKLWAVKAARTTSTFVCSLSEFSSGSLSVYQASSVSAVSTLFEEGSFFLISSYVASSTLYSGTFSATSDSHLTSGSSNPGGGGGPR